jgi:hypothetical protein
VSLRERNLTSVKGLGAVMKLAGVPLGYDIIAGSVSVMTGSPGKNRNKKVLDSQPNYCS